MKITYMKMFLTYKIFIEILKLGFFSITLDNSLKNKRNKQTKKKTLGKTVLLKELRVLLSNVKKKCIFLINLNK